jgi:DNA-binding IclR family transcriptional regulator
MYSFLKEGTAYCNVISMRPKLLLFEQATAMELLMLLSNSDKLKLSEIVRQLARPQATIYRGIAKLKELALINDETTGYPVKRFFSLTERGLRVAEKLAEVESALQEESSSMDRVQGSTAEKAHGSWS